LTDISAKQLLPLLKEAVNLSQSDPLEGSVESIRSYYKMIRQFAAMADTYQDLVPQEYDVMSVLELAGFIVDMEIEEFQNMAANLPSILDGVILQYNTTYCSETGPDPSWESVIAEISEDLPAEIDLTLNSQDNLIFEAVTDLLNRYPETSVLQNLDRWLTAHPEKYRNAMLLTQSWHFPKCM